MKKWHKQREDEISVQCEELSRKDEECRISAGVEAILEEDAVKKFTFQCKKSLSGS